MKFGAILTKIYQKNQQNCQKPVFTVELPLTEYCREEFKKFTTFLASKSPEIGQFSGEIGQFSLKNTRDIYLLHHYLSRKDFDTFPFFNPLTSLSHELFIYSQLPLYRSRRDLYYLFDIPEFRYKGSYTNGLEVLGENIDFDISGYFVISKFDIEGVDCTYHIW